MSTTVVEPYALGRWLGAGTLEGTIYASGRETILELWEKIGMVGEPKGRRIEKIPGLGKYARDSKVGLTGEKFIPRAYFDADRQTRESLLEGLLDSMEDRPGQGMPGERTLTTVKHQLAKDLVTLLMSLDFEPKMYEKNLLFEGRKVGEAWEIVWD